MQQREPTAASMPATGGHPPEARFYALDILRGVAALVVVTFHYKHFFFLSDADGFAYTSMPFYRALEPVYVYGQFFVELFFAISGYVFFWLYARGIAGRTISATGFFIARFARLYPLHLATFLLVWGLQLVFRALYGSDFIYHHNDLGNFLLTLFLVQQWQPYAELSFNGPAWSISVEAFLYLAFFVVCALRLNRWWVAAGLVVAGLVCKYAVYDPQNDFVRGVPAFFLGGLVFYAVTWLKAHDTLRQRLALLLAGAVPLMWLLAFVRCCLALWASVDIPPAPDAWSWLLNTEAFIYVCVPLSLLLLGIRHADNPLAGQGLKAWAWLGDISYSVYLIHFPLQLLVMLLATQWPVETRIAIFASPFGLAGFLGVTCGLGWLSYHLFEMPARRGLRTLLTRYLVRPQAMR